MAAREEAVDASIYALGIGNGVGGRAIALVALGGALIRLDGLGSVGTGVAQASGLAGDIACVALKGAAHGRGESSRNGDGGSRGAGDGRVLGKSESANGEEKDGRVLHGDVGTRLSDAGPVADGGVT